MCKFSRGLFSWEEFLGSGVKFSGGKYILWEGVLLDGDFSLGEWIFFNSGGYFMGVDHSEASVDTVKRPKLSEGWGYATSHPGESVCENVECK